MTNPNNGRPLMAEDGDTCEVCGAPSKHWIDAPGPRTAFTCGADRCDEIARTSRADRN